MAKFKVETQLSVAQGGGDAAKAEFKKVTDGAQQASVSIKDLTKSIGAGISIISILRANLEDMQPAIEGNVRLLKEVAVAHGLEGNAVDSLTGKLKALIDPRKIIAGITADAARASKEVAAQLVNESQVVLNLSAAQLKAVDSYLAMGGAAGLAARRTAEAAKEQTAMLEEMERRREEWQRNEERAAEERKRRNEEYRQQLQAILDRVNPVAAAERQLQSEIAMVSAELAKGGPNVGTYKDALAALRAELDALNHAADLVSQTIETMPVDRTIQLPEEAPQGGWMSIEHVETATSHYYEAFNEANQQLAANLESGLTGAFTSALVEFAQGGEDAMQHFGEAMLDILLNAVAQWLTAQLAAIAKAAAASKAIGGGGAGGVGAGGFSGFGGMSSAAGIAVAAVAVMAGLVAMFKHQSDRANAVRYDTVSGAVATNGAIQSGFQGKLGETGQKVSEAIAGLLNAFQAATGAFILGTATAEVQIRNDKERFRAVVNGVLVGEFASINEAIIAAAKTAFLNADLSSTLDPAIQQVIANFQGDDPQKMVDAINAVRQIVDEASGLTDVEIALRDLPQQTAAMAGQLMGLGVAFDEANRLAGQWQVTQLQNIRDQITGHQQSAAEQMAERQRQAALFNAQVSLMRAETQLKRDEIAVRVEALRASGQMFEGMVTLANAELQTQSLYLQSKADLYEQDTQIQQWYLDTLGQTANASLQMLEAQLAALDAMLANLPELISPGEIHMPNTGSHGGGGAISTGPTEAELAQQHADAVAQFWQDIADGWRAAMGGLTQRIAELNHWYEEQAARATELGIPLAQLNELYDQQLLNLQNDTLASLGLQSLATIQQFEDLTEALKYLTDWGTISAEQIRELGDSFYVSLVDSLLQYVDNEDVRRQLEDLRFRMEMANYQLQFQMLIGLGLLTQAEIDTIQDLLDDIWDAYNNGDLPFQRDVTMPQTNNAAEEARNAAMQALRSALDRLRNAVESLQEFQEGLSLSAQSPLTTSQQYEEAQRQYMALLAAAQGGDIDAMSQLADAAQAYLELAAEMFGTSGAGYAAIFDAVSQQVAAIAAMGQQILDSVPPQMAGTEERLDTIADILRVMAGIGSGGGTGGGNPHAGLVYYGPDWGWHPMGWSPGGNVPNPATVTTASLGSSGNLALGNFSQPGSAVIVRAPELLAEIRTLTEAHKAATVEAKNDRLKKPTFSTSGVYGRSVGSKRSA